MKNKKRLALIGGLSAILIITVILFLAFKGKPDEEKAVIESQNVIEEADRENGPESEQETETAKEPQGDQAEAVLITAPVITEETACGTDGPILDYADEHLIIFHDYFGLFAYDIMESRIIGAVDLASIGCQYTQGEDYCEVLTASNGWKVFLHPISSEDMYTYDVLNNRLTREPYDPDGKGAFYHLKETADCVDSQPYLRSFYCAPLKDDHYLYLKSGSGMASDLYYFIEQNHERVQFAKLFDDYPGEGEGGIFDYGDYTGYLDECTDWMNCSLFQGTDYDGDGLADRVYRENLADYESCNYRIEFGNGDLIEIPRMGGGIPEVSTCDIDGDGSKEILFRQYYGFSTDPMAFGETAIFRKESGQYEQLLPPQDLCAYMGDDEFELQGSPGAYQPSLTLCYEKQSEWEIRVTAKELAKVGILDETVPINDDVAAMFNSPYAEKEHRSVCYETTVVKGEKDLLEFHFEVFNKWSSDEVVVTAAYENGELQIVESRYVTEADKEKTLQGTSYGISPSKSVVIPEIEMLTFEEASAQGEVREYADTLPGSDEGVWYLVTAGGVEYIYGKYNFDKEENYELFSWALRDDSHQLANGLRVGMTEEEALEVCPALISIDFEGTGWPAWNGTAYPGNWTEEFDDILIANIENYEEELPVFLALMLKSGKIAAITQYEPTAG